MSEAFSEVVPGTVHLVDAGRSNGNDIELVPRPSDDPEDPLNWSRRRKLLSAAMVFVYTLGVGLPSTLQYSVLVEISQDTGISIADLVQGTGVMFLFLGWSCLFWQPIALTYGRRGVYLISTLASVPLMVWTAYSRSAGEWYAHRILLGFFVSPIESLPEVSIPDIFFAHERGTWMSLYVFALFGSNFLAPLVAGFFADAYGWRWTMHFGAMVSALSFVILFFFMEETIYFRPTFEGLEDQDQPSKVHPDEQVGPQQNESEKTAARDGNTGINSDQHEGTVYSKKSLAAHLKLFARKDGRPNKKNMFKSMITPLPLMVMFPNVAWAGFIYGINLCWYNVLNATTSPILSASPYNWSTSMVGLIYVGPIIGAALGCLWSGVIADRITLSLARRNNGVREPEQRLWPLALSAFLSCVGLIVWGVGADKDIHWAGLAVGLMVLTFSCDISGDTTTSIIIIRNTLGFAISYGITPCTFLFMIWKGKSLRRHAAPRYWDHIQKMVYH
ncbi:hypothetical protein F53441_11211 [Fusarium austroafricanum]|uniref:Major facilitator superfamily (MFS) profile domain-containing protein n=1 Tax=Fusarium austroafricanum TaxID=2364996 RepID=A0A8H4NT07_9HYPO|nr:hypothetical protein F53441_11211 [Fusarium austroafricanum]